MFAELNISISAGRNYAETKFRVTAVTETRPKPKFELRPKPGRNQEIWQFRRRNRNRNRVSVGLYGQQGSYAEIKKMKSLTFISMTVFNDGSRKPFSSALCFQYETREAGEGEVFPGRLTVSIDW